MPCQFPAVCPDSLTWKAVMPALQRRRWESITEASVVDYDAESDTLLLDSTPASESTDVACPALQTETTVSEITAESVVAEPVNPPLPTPSSPSSKKFKVIDQQKQSSFD